MKFGLFFNPIIPKPSGQPDWEPEQERSAFLEMLEQIRYADSLGLDYVFLGEHHFMPEYAHNSAPEVLLGAIAASTSKIRLGTGIVHASHNDPVRTAERIATLDQLTGGRTEFGFGGGTDAEVAPLMRSEFAGSRREVAAASARISADILATRGVWGGVDNEFFTYQSVNVVPKSYQDPHPPLWTSVAVPGQTAEVAERGLGVLMLSIAGPEAAATDVENYWAALRSDRVDPVGRGVNPAVFVNLSVLLARTDEQAEERARSGMEFFGFGLTGGAVFGVNDPQHHLYDAFLDFKAGRRDIRLDAPIPEESKPLMLGMGANFADLPGVLMAGPEKAISVLKSYEDAHVDGVIMRYDVGISHEHAMESLEILAKEVIPEFRAREDDHQAWRKRQLEGVAHPIVSSI
ncbi:LLM class flavin-dependent oxidoreductase [Nocardia asiatica]|uniref:LLM class flavin-dependent oxidoreductase n=1 Tax=Nocardia asiatica TaxID=209252 RepID=UPI00031976C5|nr:LLM class flavin-dependent oxidoreductase [Nocardia asiatica]